MFLFFSHLFRLRLRPGCPRSMCMSTASCGVHSSGCFDASAWSRCTWACICLKRQLVESWLCVFWRSHWAWGDRLSTSQAPRLPLRQRRVHRRRRDCTTGPPPHNTEELFGGGGIALQALLFTLWVFPLPTCRSSVWLRLSSRWRHQKFHSQAEPRRFSPHLRWHFVHVFPVRNTVHG